MVKVCLLLALIFLLALTPGLCHLKLNEICVRAGEMVKLECPGGAKLVWTSNSNLEIDLSIISPTEQRKMGVLVHGMSLIILSASVNHQRNYSCSMGNDSSRFRLTVNTTKFKAYDERTKYSETCYTQQSCNLNCPDVNIPALNTPNITSKDITWHKVILKEGEPLPSVGYFQRVEEKNRGVYTCTRSYLYHGQIYNKTFTVILDVKPKKDEKTARINFPQMNEVVYVDLGSPKVIDCEAVLYSEFDGVFWLSGNFSVEENPNLPVFSNKTRQTNGDQIKMTASLVFKKVSEEDLKNYACKLEAVHQSSDYVTISLKKVPHSYMPLALSTLGIMVVMTVSVVIYVKLKIHIILFLRDTLGCHRSTSDGKSYDAFVMCYKSNTDVGLNAHDRKCLENVLEERFGYNLCLYDRDILPGKAVAQAVLDCIGESRTMILVPTALDPGIGSSLLIAIHEALVERQTQLIFIKTEKTNESMPGSLPEALQLLSEAGYCVTWKGMSCMQSSSFFWKQLRFYLPASQAPMLRAVTQII